MIIFQNFNGFNDVHVFPYIHASSNYCSLTDNNLCMLGGGGGGGLGGGRGERGWGGGGQAVVMSFKFFLETSGFMACIPLSRMSGRSRLTQFYTLTKLLDPVLV